MGFMSFHPADVPRLAVRGATFARTVAKFGARRLNGRIRESLLSEDLHPQDHDEFVAAAYFPADLSSVYQLEQWLWPFEQLEARLKGLGYGRRPFGIFVRNAVVAEYLKGVTTFPVRFSRLTSGLDKFMQSPSLRAVFYVNQGTSNFQALRYRDPAHIHLSHGESEKISMISNQLKAYDYVFTAGQAARARIELALYGMSEEHMWDVGRPQLDRPRSIPQTWEKFEKTHPDGRVVFYAPTWEGDSPAMAYGAIAYNGVELVTALLEGGYRVIFRPHPRTGVMNHEFKKAVEDVTSIVEAAPGGYVDTSQDVSWQLDEADLAVVEMTSVAFDWLSTGKPLVMVRPHHSEAEILNGGLLDYCPTLEADGRESIVELLDEAFSGIDSVASLANFYLGDTAAGEQIARFIDGSLKVIDERSEQRRVKHAE